MAKIIELIYTEEKRGLGKADDPSRIIPQLYTKAGKLVAESDAYNPNLPAKMIFLPEELDNA